MEETRLRLSGCLVSLLHYTCYLHLIASGYCVFQDFEPSQSCPLTPNTHSRIRGRKQVFTGFCTLQVCRPVHPSRARPGLQSPCPGLGLPLPAQAAATSPWGALGCTGVYWGVLAPRVRHIAGDTPDRRLSPAPCLPIVGSVLTWLSLELYNRVELKVFKLEFLVIGVSQRRAS